MSDARPPARLLPPGVPHEIERTTSFRALVGAAVVVMVVGGLLPFYTDTFDGGTVTYRILTMGFQATGLAIAEGDASEDDVTVIVVFLLPFVVAIASLVLLVLAARRRGSPRRLRVERWFGVLLALSVAGLAYVAWFAVERDSATLGPGVWVYGVGALAGAAVLIGDSTRDA